MTTITKTNPFLPSPPSPDFVVSPFGSPNWFFMTTPPPCVEVGVLESIPALLSASLFTQATCEFSSSITHGKGFRLEGEDGVEMEIRTRSIMANTTESLISPTELHLESMTSLSSSDLGSLGEFLILETQGFFLMLS